MTSTRPSFDVLRVTVTENYCPPCDRVTKHYGADCVRCCEPEPRALPMLPREDGLGFGLHATTPPAWRVDWWAVARWGVWLLAGGLWALVAVGTYHLLWCRP